MQLIPFHITQSVAVLTDWQTIKQPQFSLCRALEQAGHTIEDAHECVTTRMVNYLTQGHTVTDAPQLPLNLLDALRNYDHDEILKAAMGSEFSSAFIKLKMQEWNSFTAHFSNWERDNTLDV